VIELGIRHLRKKERKKSTKKIERNGYSPPKKERKNVEKRMAERKFALNLSHYWWYLPPPLLGLLDALKIQHALRVS